MSTNTAMWISIIRYYIKFKAGQSEIVELENFITFIKYNKMFCYLVFTIMTILHSWFRIGPGLQVCTNELTDANWSLSFGLAFLTLNLIQKARSSATDLYSGVFFNFAQGICSAIPSETSATSSTEIT